MTQHLSKVFRECIFKDIQKRAGGLVRISKTNKDFQCTDSIVVWIKFAVSERQFIRGYNKRREKSRVGDEKSHIFNKK
jgi:hypothetical protein